MQMLTTEAAQAEIINEDFTSPETVLPLPSFGRNLQCLPQQAFWRWSIQNLPWEKLRGRENPLCGHHSPPLTCQSSSYSSVPRSSFMCLPASMSQVATPPTDQPASERESEPR